MSIQNTISYRYWNNFYLLSVGCLFYAGLLHYSQGYSIFSMITPKGPRPAFMSTLCRYHRPFHKPSSVFRSSRMTYVSLSNGNGISSCSLTAISTPTNEYLVKNRLAAAAEKRQRRKATLEQDRQRNLRIKRILHSSTNTSTSFGNATSESGHAIPPMYALRISVEKELREELRMNGREKRGRAFVEMGTDGCKTLKGLKMEVHSFFRCLKKSTYLLFAALPTVLDDGSIFSPGNEQNQIDDGYADFMKIDKDQDVEKIFEKALTFYYSHNKNQPPNSQTLLKRPSLLLHVRKDPNAPLPRPIPSYLSGMENPEETDSITMLSFYAFPPDGGIKDPEKFGFVLRKLWKPFGALGRVYVAVEGVNAQMSVPTNVLENFKECCNEIPELGIHMENGINIDPITLTKEEFAVAGDMDGKPVPPFKSLNIRVREQIVADGLGKPLDWQQAGYDMPPMEWHKKVKEVKEKQGEGKEKDTPLIFDCRNEYETSVGRFEGSQPLNTENFRDTWDALKEKLEDEPKDKPIMTYCTGGIRCVKVGAYLTQELGFTNVSRLAGGIIAYDRALDDNDSNEEPLFKGTNYVFDGRVGRQITNDAFATCVTCDKKTNLLGNCNNPNCHKRIAQCLSCRKKYLGTCSESCKTRVLKSRMMVAKENVDVSQSEELHETKYNTVNEYSSGYSTPPPPLYKEIELNTAAYIKTGVHMISDATQGRILKNLASMAREGRILEIGTFSGYSTMCFLEGAADAADVIGSKEVGNREGGAFVMSLERDSRAINLAASHLKIMSQYGIDEEAANEASKLRQESDNVITVEGDSVSFSYKKAQCEICRVTDALATLEAMANDIEYTTTVPFDIVFIDGDKTRFLDYVEACLSNNRVLKKGGLMVVDNVLWKGLVLDTTEEEEEEEELSGLELKKSRRARKLASVIHKFNSAIIRDSRVEVVMLPIRDGLSVIRKK